MESAVKLKKCMVSISILGVIIGKLRHEKKLCLIILLDVNKGLEVDFHHAILPFILSLCLWVKDDREFMLDTKEIA